MGFPELGYVSISEIQDAVNPRRLLFLERDLHFVGKYPISVYADAARSVEQITEDESILQRFSPKI